MLKKKVKEQQNARMQIEEALTYVEDQFSILQATSTTLVVFLLLLATFKPTPVYIATFVAIAPSILLFIPAQSPLPLFTPFFVLLMLFNLKKFLTKPSILTESSV